MTSIAFKNQFDPERMCNEVAEALQRIYLQKPDPSYLIFPEKRFGVRRVSEQESRILVTQWLQRASLSYSIETPTTKTFIQQGVTAQSALTDVTVYSQGDGAKRELNIELKAGQPGVESFRKDLEKLLQEQIPGMWFHTLVTASPNSWKALYRKIERALASLEVRFYDEFDTATHSIYFYFCVLDGASIPPFYVGFGTWREDLDRGFASVRP